MVALNPGRPSTPGRLTTTASVWLGVGLFAAWTFATFLLEGLPRTFQRPEAIGARVDYALARTGQSERFETVQLPLVGMALLALGVLVLSHRRLLGAAD